MTVALPEQDEIVGLSSFEEFEIPCEVPSFTDDHKCQGDPAEWVAFRRVICPCGIIVRIVCNVCKEDYQRMMAQFAYIQCPRCETETGGFSRFERLVKGS